MAVELFKLELIYHNLALKKRTMVKLFLLATTMASIPCFNLLIPIDGCDPSWTIEATKARLNASDLDAAFSDLMAANWLIDGYETLSIGRDSARAVMVLKKLGFADAMGLYKSCASLFRDSQRPRALPFNEGSFDFVFSTEMIDGVRVPARLVLEMERVLRPARIGVVMRRVSGNFPVTAVMKAAAPVAAFLRFSDVVAVRTVNCTVLVVFRKRTLAGHEKHKVIEQKKLIPADVMTKKPLNSAKNYVGTYASLKKKLAKADPSVVGKSARGPITEMPRKLLRNNVEAGFEFDGNWAGALITETPRKLSRNYVEAGFELDGNGAGALITETPRKSAANYVAAYATLKKRLRPLFGAEKNDGNSITEKPRGPAGNHLGGYATTERYLLNMPSFVTKKRNVKGG